MDRVIEEGKTPTYTIRKSTRARHMRLVVYCDGAVVLTAPTGVATSVIERFLEEKKDWILKKIRAFQKAGLTLVRIQQSGDYRKRKEEALRLVLNRIAHFNEHCGVWYNAVRIKNQKTCWGSCSRKGNININYKILYLPHALQDYIIVHELCHLKEFNHSKIFWAHVAVLIPEYKNIRKELQKIRLLHRNH